MSELRDAVRPGDIVNSRGFRFNGLKTFFWDLLVSVGLFGITNIQWKLFTQVFPKDKVRWQDTHTRIFFDPDHIFSVTTPFPQYEKLEADESPSSPETVSVYRPNPGFFGEVLAADVAIMRDEADQIVANHEGYDIGELLDIGADVMYGHAFSDETNTLDADGSHVEDEKSHLVCSVGSRLVYERWLDRKALSGAAVRRPFSELNHGAWNAWFFSAFKNYGKSWAVGMTTPAHFANTPTHFQSEFLFVGTFKKGKRIA